MVRFSVYLAAIQCVNLKHEWYWCLPAVPVMFVSVLTLMQELTFTPTSSGSLPIVDIMLVMEVTEVVGGWRFGDPQCQFLPSSSPSKQLMKCVMEGVQSGRGPVHLTSSVEVVEQLCRTADQSG